MKSENRLCSGENFLSRTVAAADTVIAPRLMLAWPAGGLTYQLTTAGGTRWGKVQRSVAGWQYVQPAVAEWFGVDSAAALDGNGFE